MSEVKHTPGPWAIHPVDDTMVVKQMPDGSWVEIANTDGDYNQPDTWPTMEANTRLISAAPDLLEALEGAVAMLETVVIHDENSDEDQEEGQALWNADVHKFRLAIAKARGRG